MSSTRSEPQKSYRSPPAGTMARCETRWSFGSCASAIISTYDPLKGAAAPGSVVRRCATKVAYRQVAFRKTSPLWRGLVLRSMKRLTLHTAQSTTATQQALSIPLLALGHAPRPSNWYHAQQKHNQLLRCGI